MQTNAQPKPSALEKAGLVKVGGVVMTKAEAAKLRATAPAKPNRPSAAGTKPKAAAQPTTAIADGGPVLKAIADQAALVDTAPAKAETPAQASAPAPATVAPVASFGAAADWSDVRADMLDRTGRA